MTTSTTIIITTFITSITTSISTTTTNNTATINAVATGRRPIIRCSKAGVTASVTGYISKCIDDVTVSKTITTRPNQKPWMPAEVRMLLRTRDSAFRTGDRDALRKARAKLQNDQVLCLTAAEVRRTLHGVNPQKSARPDNIPGHVLRECADQLADVLTDIFNISLSCTVVPTCFKTTTIVPVPKKPTVSCLNDYHPVALTSIIMNCFERLVMRHIKTQFPPSLDPLQFAYCSNRSTDDAVSTTLHLALPQKGHLRENAVHRLQFSIQHHRSSASDWKVELTGLEHLPLQLDPGFLDW
ncbi:hypothetical protein P4O66_019004 [Electrophorus voltai]|uniref:Reverse transcriptase domain-containing protein n=1 Tax=Electrophorus voltai TaxID=2609070 RepID=A0AAD9DN05_9TELE|nr:hypothetical protein P4O66_019004 [Electrophorus voltai]